MERVYLAVFASLFVVAGLRHIKNHAAMADFAGSALGNGSLSKLGYLGGWPTGLFLTVFGVGTVVNYSSVYAYGLAAFLAVATVLYHRNFWKDPGGFKGVSLLGAALYIASQVPKVH